MGNRATRGERGGQGLRPTRKQLGQWYTPEPVADLALSLALRRVPSPASILDPSCGDGVFLRAAKARGVCESRLVGVDIDPRAIAAAATHVPKAELICADFFAAQRSRAPVDIVLGNPPYVRQERHSADEKARIADEVAASHEALALGDVSALVGRSDLAAPFVLRSLAALRPGGVAVLVLSSAFFDAGYGAEFWSLAERIATVELVVDAPGERWFEEAAVHAVIAVFRRMKSEEPVSMVRLRESTRVVATRVARGEALAEVAELRNAPRKSPERWSQVLRAPAPWLSFCAQADGALVPLGELATIRRGITSGANDIFYMTRAEAQERGIPERFLTPLLTARERGGNGAILVSAAELALVALVVPKDTALEEEPELRGYLESARGDALPKGLRNREPWWAVRAVAAQVFLCKAYAQRFVQPFSPQPIVADQRMYCLTPKADIDSELLAALVNSVPTALALESLGRASMGQGALEWTTGDLRRLPVLDIRNHPHSEEFLEAFRVVSRRSSGSAHEELREDRHRMNRALLAPWPALQAMQETLATALSEACRARAQRSKAGLR